MRAAALRSVLDGLAEIEYFRYLRMISADDSHTQQLIADLERIKREGQTSAVDGVNQHAPS